MLEDSQFLQEEALQRWFLLIEFEVKPHFTFIRFSFLKNFSQNGLDSVTFLTICLILYCFHSLSSDQLPIDWGGKWANPFLLLMTEFGTSISKSTRFWYHPLKEDLFTFLLSFPLRNWSLLLFIRVAETFSPKYFLKSFGILIVFSFNCWFLIANHGLLRYLDVMLRGFDQLFFLLLKI